MKKGRNLSPDLRKIYDNTIIYFITISLGLLIPVLFLGVN
ncbi:hypothetical protein SAMN03092900_0420 [Thiomicrospira sp. ALE5]|nr:hypothetical protein SAMN03092900_0420 [Thiomicrospira sp. ALE5]